MRMTDDDLSPADQARAARWAADWLDQAYTDRCHEIAADDLRKCADFVDRFEKLRLVRAEKDRSVR